MSEDRAQGSLLVSSLQHRRLPAFGRNRRSGEKNSDAMENVHFRTDECPDSENDKQSFLMAWMLTDHGTGMEHSFYFLSVLVK